MAKIIKHILILGSLFMFSGCGSFMDVMDLDKISTDEKAGAFKVQILPIGSTISKEAEYVGHIESTSCKSLITDPPASTQNATEQLKIKAFRLKANAISDFSCDKSQTDAWGTNCWNSVTCAGTAIKIP